ncbi:hypothetical protein [Pelotalea chapellei]|uniref:Lipoprotein n=1 Tax=Pelotalea chapellei TaxID=44671 RepID=A0ABS5U9X2_9BACT|nr:hypothetical protein [Pelotalea chapellei]MBT1072441.1 hypothetical protein [Pelotalea chapellei]
MMRMKMPLMLVGLALVSGCATKGYVSTQTDPIVERLSTLEQKMSTLDARVPALDSRVTVLDSRVPAMESKLTTLDTRMTTMENKPAPRAELSPADQTAIREARDMAKAALDKANSAEAAAQDALKRSDKMFNLHQKK